MLSVVVKQQVDVKTTSVAKEQKTMGKTYAIADLHGRFDLLATSSAKSAFGRPWLTLLLIRANELRIGQYVAPHRLLDL
jgi:hypothetical protein